MTTPANTPDPQNLIPLTPHPGYPTGPRTDSGKATASQNALTHGLRSNRPVVGDERESDYHAYLTATAGSLAPSDPIELALAERAASALWRLKRATRYEDEIIALNLERVDQDVLPDTPGGLSALRARLAERRQGADRLRCFPSLPDATPIPTPDALSLILAVAAETDSVDPDLLTLPHVPGKPSIHDFDRWTARTIRALLSSIAALNHKAHPDDDRDPAALLQDAAASAEDAAASLQIEVTHAQLAAARLARERCVPPPDAVDRIIRYEAHVAKQLTTALHELEALQTRRAGGTAHLARLDVSGPPDDIAAKRTP